MRRFLLDNDGSNIFFKLGDDVEGMVAETVRECPPTVSTYLLCTGAGTSYWPTKIGTVMPQMTGLLAAHARGQDPIGMLLRGLKASGKEVFITYRMNDVHNPDAADQWNTPRVRREHPDCVVGLDEIRAGKAEWMSYCLDYSRAEVREYVLALIREQVALYGDTIDGFQLDWMRFPRHLSGDPEQVWAKRDVITAFMADVRALLEASGRRILLGARVPTTPAGCRRLGLDLAEWGKRGLLDLLTICPFLTTEWTLPVAEIRALLGAGTLPVYAGFDFNFGNQTHFPESLRGICTSLYDCGADGIYAFNFPCWTEYLLARPYHWLVGLERPETASAKPLLLAVDTTLHKISGVDQPGQLPATLPAGGTLALTLHVPRAALPAWRALALVHSHGDVGLAVNGCPASLLRLGQMLAQAHRSEIFCEFVDQYHNTQARPQPSDCRGFTVAPAALQAGDNTLLLTNLGGADLVIERVNLGLW